MNKRMCWTALRPFLAVLLLAAFAAGAEEAKVRALNPRGSLPPIRLASMAPRLASLDGKTVYIISASFGEPLMPEMQKVLTETYPKTTWVLRNKPGSYFDDDPKLWAEIKEKGQAMIMGVGH
jgi:hypothetical protein